MSDLVLPLKDIYFNQIKAGTKAEEFRLCTPYWRRRLEGRTFDRIVLTLGYPTHLGRDEVVKALPGIAGRLHYLRLTKDGYPGHPLYLPASLVPTPWTDK